MEKENNNQQQPENSSASTITKESDADNTSSADSALLATESPKFSNEENPVEAEKTQGEMETNPPEETTETDKNNVTHHHHHQDVQPGKPEEDRHEAKEKEEGGERGGEDAPPPPPPPVPEIEYTLEKGSDDIENFLSNFSISPPKEEEKEGDGDNISGFEIPQFLDNYLDLVEEKISKHDSPESRVKGSQLSEDDSFFLKSVERISKLYKILSGVFKLDSKDHGALINRIGRIQQRAMSYLEDEFRSLLEDLRVIESQDHKQEASDQSDSSEKNQSADQSHVKESDFQGYSQEILTILKKIAKEMIFGGYESECCEVFIITRTNVIDDSLNKIGFQKVSVDEVLKMQWESLEREIPTWIKAFKQCANVYFPGERRLVETIFSDHQSLSDSLFTNLTRGVEIQLLNFAEAVAISKRSTEKLFKVLDIYETLRDNVPAIDNLFPEQCANELKTEITTARCRIGETAISIFSDFENSIRSDTGKTPVPGGAVHPLTRYTMNYLKYACEYKDTVEQVFKEHSKIERADSTSRPRDYNEGNSQNYNQGDDSQSPFAGQLMRIMALLDANLETRSRLYKDVSLSCIFMMNNGRYMLQKIKGAAEIYQVMGDTWCRKRSSDLRNYHKSYQRETWSKLLGCLSHEGLNNHGKVSKPVLKERFKSFNAMFDEIHKTQSSWVVSDEQLQSELRVSISAVMIPAYRSFLGRFSQYLDPGRQTEKYIKFQPEDIETYIDELFDGNPTSMARRRT